MLGPIRKFWEELEIPEKIVFPILTITGIGLIVGGVYTCSNAQLQMQLRVIDETKQAECRRDVYAAFTNYIEMTYTNSHEGLLTKIGHSFDDTGISYDSKQPHLRLDQMLTVLDTNCFPRSLQEKYGSFYLHTMININRRNAMDSEVKQ